MAGASRIRKFVKSNLLREYDVDLLGPEFDFDDFSQQASRFVRSTAACSATFRRDLLFQLLNPYNIISAVTALQAAAQLEVGRLIFCVLRDEHLSIDRPVCPFFRLAYCCWLRRLYRCHTSSRTLWRVGVRSRTFSAITDLIVVVQREVDRSY